MSDITERCVFNPRLLMEACRHRQETMQEVWGRYEREKAHLQAMDLSPDEYERAVHDLASRLGV